MILQTKVFKAFDFGSGRTPTSGQIEFRDPWGEPPSYSIILEYENPGALALEKATWGLVKRLYKR